MGLLWVKHLTRSTDPAAVRSTTPTPQTGQKHTGPGTLMAFGPGHRVRVTRTKKASVGSLQMFPLIRQGGIGLDKGATDV